MASQANSYRQVRAVTPSDTVNLPIPTYALWVGGAGTLSVVNSEGQTIAIAAVPAGALIPITVTRVRATGTSATAILALG
jgi:hypothetical protein